MHNIRNFCIIAHIDHGKSTLADRMLELTGTIEKREMREQLLDQLDLERERGITIKLAPVRMTWRYLKTQNSKLKPTSQNSNLSDSEKTSTDLSYGFEICDLPSELSSSKYTLNLIDTPGHVDFAYEVSRSLAAVEGAILLVDATQGVEAQTLSVLYAAMEHDLKIIPVINKIDLPAARPEETAAEIIKILGCDKSEILYVSGKTGQGVGELLDAVVERMPGPQLKTQNSKLKPTSQNSNLSDSEKTSTDLSYGFEICDLRSNLTLRALIFDSIYDPFRGVVAFVRVFEGEIKKGDHFTLIQTKSEGEVLETGYFSPKFVPHSPLLAGEIGYIITGFKDVAEARVGDTITLKNNLANSPLPGYKQVLPLVFASIYCADGSDYPELKEAIEKLKLNDSSLTFEQERSEALGFGFRCGFLGLLHLDIVRERLEREYNLSLVISSPTVEYHVNKLKTQNSKLKPTSQNSNLSDSEKTSTDLSYGFEICDLPFEIVNRPSDFPAPGTYTEILEPMVKLEVFTPKEYVGDIMSVVQNKRAVFETMEYLDESRVILRYKVPLAEVIIDLYDQLKSVSRGYASMNYELANYEPAELEKVDIMIAEEQVDALSFITHKVNAYSEAKRIVERLKELIPRQNFEIKIQATIGAKIIASERISPFRKDVTAKLYGGDVTRKNKLLEKQKKGKKKMKQIGKVEVPSDVFVRVLRSE